MRIGILGGTFNPPHIGHTHAAKAAIKALGLDTVLFVPAALPPHKTIPEGSATGEQRMEMARLAAESIGAKVSDIEFKRPGKSYTAETLRFLKEEYPSAQFWLIMGTDMFLSIHTWYRPEDIFSAAHIAVVAREAMSADAIIAQRKKLKREFDAKIDLIDTEVLEISSTQLRCDGSIASEYLCQPVREYILKNRLYENSEV